MSLTRIGHFQAQPDKVEALRAQFESILPQVRASDGCESAHLLQSHEDPTRLVVIEVWASEEAHKASFKNVDPEQVQATLAMLDGTPSGAYYEVVD